MHSEIVVIDLSHPPRLPCEGSSVIDHQKYALRNSTERIGFGGHAAEMINVLTVLQKDMFLPRIYVAAATDNMSLQKAWVLEYNMVDRAGGKGISAIHANLQKKQGSRFFAMALGLVFLCV